MRQSIGLAVAGIAVGLAGATAVTRLISGLLFELQPTDPMTYAFVAIMLLVLAGVACFIPATRALAIEPVEALRAR
jgi:ABC-type lipoprotein release transport system permease subunit